MNPLKILIANNTLSLLAGSETYAFTLAVQLKRMGHMVECFSPELGVISRELEKEDIQSTDSISVSGVKPFSIVLEPEKVYDYDVIIASHNHIVEFLRKQFPKTPIISVIHGIIHMDDRGKMAPEHPALDAKVDRFVAVSEEVQELLRKEYGLESTLIRNFVDVARFDAKRPISPSPKQFLVNTNYSLPNDPEIKVIREVAKHYGAKLGAVGQNFSAALDMMLAIEDADIVVGMGRSVLEGVCAGRLGIVHGRWGTGGVVCESNIRDIRTFNFSGRNSKGHLMDAESLIAEIDRYYNPSTIEWSKKYARAEHNAAFAAQTFVQLARELIAGKVNSGVDPAAKPYRRANA